MKRFTPVLLGILFFVLTVNAQGLFRYPDVCGTKVVFSHAGDLWMVPVQGGRAWRLTSSPGLEISPKFSRDCTKIAFTAQYDGNFNIYVMNADGTNMHQVTFEGDVGDIPGRFGPNNMVLGWTPDNKILFFSRRDTFNIWFGRLFTISPDGGWPTSLPLPKGGLASFSPEGQRLAYNRIFRNFRTWKHYKGGMAQNLWIYDFKTKKTTEITNLRGTESYPVWVRNRIYFSSDNGGDDAMNIYYYDYSTHDIKQITHFKDYDCLWLSGENMGTKLVFQHGAGLYLLETRKNTVQKLSIQLPGDHPYDRTKWVNGGKYLTSFDLSPHGKRTVFTARGDVFSVPVKRGDTRNLTRSSNAFDRYATWSPNGKWIAYISDKSGDDELYMTSADTNGKTVRLTFDGHCKKYAPVWSPDSKKLAFADKEDKLYYVDVNKKDVKPVDKAEYWEIRQYTWSGDSRFIAYQKTEDNMFGRIYIYSLNDKKTRPVTSYFTNDSMPSFDPDGRYLYFVSDVQWNPALSDFEMSFIYQKTGRILALTLRRDVKSPGLPVVDEAEAAKKTKKHRKKKGKKTKRLSIDFDGIESRVFELPGNGDNIRGMTAVKNGVLYLSVPVEGLGGPYSGESTAMHLISLNTFKNYKLIEGTQSFAVSAGMNKVMLNFKGKFFVTSIPHVKSLNSKPSMKKGDMVSLTGLGMRVNLHQEWQEIFNNAWRLERDFFYSPMYNHKTGLAFWKAIRDKYQKLLPFVQHRYDLTFVLGEMIGELANSHTYVGGGDMPGVAHGVKYGFLGVDWTLDAKSGRYRIRRILPGQNWRAGFVSPLARPGIGVKTGDYVLKINGQTLKAPDVPGHLMQNTVGKTISLVINSKPSLDHAKTVWVKPVNTEINLRHLLWIKRNRQRVDKLSNGRIGYIFIPDMETLGLNEFVRQYFPQLRKQALVIDVRYNGGGFVDEMIFERLRRILVGMMSARSSKPFTVPDQVFTGPIACVTNHYAASDGDFFSYFFKKYKLGKLIGTRTWGGVRGIRGYTWLIDHGYTTQPEFALYSTHSKWLLENHGVEPDIRVDNLPEEVMAGHDPQLETAVKLLLDQINAHPTKLPHLPPFIPAYPPNSEE